MASGSSTGHSDQHIPISISPYGSTALSHPTWSLVTVQTIYIRLALVVTQTTELEKDPSYNRTVDPDMGFGSTLG